MEDSERQGSSPKFRSYVALRNVQVNQSQIKSMLGNTFCVTGLGIEAGRVGEFLWV